MPCSHRLPDKHQRRPIWLGGWGADTRRTWYLSCDDGVKSFPQLKLRHNSLWENAGVEIFSEIQRKRGQVHEPQMLGRDRQNCSLKELGPRPGILGWEPTDVTAPFTSWGGQCPLLDQILAMTSALWCHHLWIPRSPASGMAVQLPTALSTSLPALKR